MPQPNQISTAQLARLIGLPDAPAIIDVRLPEDRALDSRLIPGSFLLDHTACDPAPARLQGKRVVVVCAKGRKLSEGVAVLEGGSLAWAAADLPMVPLVALPASNLWVTRQRPKVDRIACPWLIRRFVDRSARFLYVAPAEVAAVAERFGATPFDIEGVFFTHRDERCSFDTMLEVFGLSTPALERLATVVRAADTDRHDLAPQAAGLLAISVGLSRQFRDDLEQLEAGMGVYDALYRWARDGFEEGHDWPAGRPA